MSAARCVGCLGREAGIEQAQQLGRARPAKPPSGAGLSPLGTAGPEGRDAEQQLLPACTSIGWPNLLLCVQQGVLNAFFPKPAEVTPDYWAYTQWRCCHRLCSAVLHNFSTQARCVPVVCVPLPGIACRAAGTRWPCCSWR